MKAYKSTALLAASTATRMLLALYTVKITAVTLGLAGTGVIGQFNNLLLISTMLAGGGIASGIIKAVADPDTPLSDVRHKLRSAHGYACICSVAMLAIVLVGHQFLGERLLPTAGAGALLIALAVGQYGLFHIAALSAVVNGRGRQDLFAKSTLAAGVASAIAVTIGCLAFGLPGTLVGMLLGALSQWLFLHFLASRHLPEWAPLGTPSFEVADLKPWIHFSLLSLITVVGMPTAQIAVRNALAASAGWEMVGVWQAMVRLSDAYLQFGLLFLSAFYFPRLAAAPTIPACTAVILRYGRVLLPAMVGLCGAIYLLRFQIVPLLFSSAFLGVTELFMPQLIGDVAKIASYLITYAFLATGRYKLSMAAELVQAALFWVIARHVGIDHGPAGVAWSYAAAYLTYFVLVAGTMLVLIRQASRTTERSGAAPDNLPEAGPHSPT